MSVDKDGCNIMHILANNIKRYDMYDEFYKIILEKHPELLSMKNKKGQTPLDITKKKKYFNQFIKTKSEKSKNKTNTR